SHKNQDPRRLCMAVDYLAEFITNNARVATMVVKTLRSNWEPLTMGFFKINFYGARSLNGHGGIDVIAGNNRDNFIASCFDTFNDISDVEHVAFGCKNGHNIFLGVGSKKCALGRRFIDSN
ncbi:hypothetical protein U1Q18_021940, partial [Sarracenia purpurea var. burkii]